MPNLRVQGKAGLIREISVFKLNLAHSSRLYSEKAYVLSRSFVRTAIERPPAGLEKEIRHLYFQKGRLASVVEHSQRLIRKGEEQASRAINEVEEEDEQMWNADAVGSLTMGAILTLKVGLKSLVGLVADE